MYVASRYNTVNTNVTVETIDLWKKRSKVSMLYLRGIKMTIFSTLFDSDAQSKATSA